MPDFHLRGHHREIPHAQVNAFAGLDHYVPAMGELVLHAVVAAVESLFELVCVRTASVVLPIISFGTLTTTPRSSHPPAYRERRPICIGPLVSMLFGVVFWTVATIAFVAMVR